ncbi:MAG: GDP-mannose 4,6-dehydratase, partial [Proteobacteria bacterium]|nr:GDP-mannose 4,6-dehydratase [Pseudomonadota bacterium]
SLWTQIATDVSSQSNVENIIREYRPRYVLNLIGLISGNSVSDHIDINALVSKFILEACLIYPGELERVLLIGSAAEYGVPKNLPVSEGDPLKPLSPYGLAKVIQSEIAQFFWRSHGLPVCIARPFNLVGRDLPASLAIGSFVQQIHSVPSGGAVKVGNLSVRRDFLDIGEAMRAYWMILTNGNSGQAYNVCSGNSILLGDVLHELIRLSGKSLKIDGQVERYRSNDVVDIYGSYEKINRDLGWTPEHRLSLESPVWASLLSR